MIREFKGPKRQRGFVGIASLIVSGLSAGVSLVKGKKASKAGKRANAAQQKINRLINARKKRAFKRNFRQQQANNLTGSVAAGIGLESSRTQGTASSEKTQLGSELIDFAKFDKLGAEVASQRQKSADANFKSQAFGQVSSFASQFISFGKKPDATVDPE